MSILAETLRILDKNIHRVHPEVQLFLFSVRDWLAHLISESLLWQEYGWSLKAAILHRVDRHEAFYGPDPETRMLIDQVAGAPLTLTTLLYRHYLVNKVLDEEILTTLEFTPFFSLIATMLTQSIAFSPLTDSDIWEGISTDPHPITVLRRKRLSIQRFAQQLAMRDDLTDHQLIRDHGLLSSLSLLYGLHLTCVILTHEITVRPDESLTVIFRSLSNTLADLKGVFNNVERSWLIPHVR